MKRDFVTFMSEDLHSLQVAGAQRIRGALKSDFEEKIDSTFALVQSEQMKDENEEEEYQVENAAES